MASSYERQMAAYKQRKKKEEEESKKSSSSSKSSTATSTKVASASSSSKSSSDAERDRQLAAYQQRRKEWVEKAKDVDTNYINTFISDARKHMSTAKDDLDRADFNTSSSIYSSRLQTSRDLRERADKVKSYLKLHGDDDTDLFSFVDSFSSSDRELQRVLKNRSNYYSQWNTEDAYIWGSDETREERQKRYTSNKARIEEINHLLNDGGAKFFPSAEERAEIKALKDEREALIAENTNYERGTSGFAHKASDDYYDVTQQKDFAITSQKRDYDNPTREELDTADLRRDSFQYYEEYDENGNVITYDALGNRVTQESLEALERDTEIKDKLGMFLNASEEERAEAQKYTVSDETSWSTAIKDGIANSWDYLSEPEIGIYYTLYNTQGQDAAYQYLEDMQVELSRRKTYELEANIAKDYQESSMLEKILLNVAAVPMGIYGGLVAEGENIINAATGKETNPYSDAQSISRTADAIKGNTAQSIDKATNGANILGIGLGDAYQTAMSIAESYGTLALFGTSKMGDLFRKASFFSNAASSKARDLYESGATENQIALGSALAGASELIFEEISIEKFLEPKEVKNFGQFLLEGLKQGGVESFEEGATEIANFASDVLVMKSQSEWQKSIEAYMEEGMTRSEASGMAFADAAMDVWKAVVGGFFSGEFGGSVSAGASWANYNAWAEAEGKRIMESGGSAALKNLSEEMAGVGKSKDAQNLSEYVDRINKAKSESKVNRAVGRLSDQVNVAVESENLAQMQAEIEKKGIESKTAKKLAKSLMNEMETGAFSKKDFSRVLANLDSAKDLRDLRESRDEFVADRKTKTAMKRAGFVFDENGEVDIDATVEAAVKADADVENASYTVSTEGKTLDAKGNEVKIVDFDSVKTVNGKTEITYKLDNGETISHADIEYASEAEAVVYQNMARMGASIEATQNILKNFNESDGVSAGVYASAASLAYSYGLMNDLQSLKNANYLGLTTDQAMTAFYQGQNDASTKSEKAQSYVEEVYAEAQKTLKQAGKTKDAEYHAILADNITEKQVDTIKGARESYEMAEYVAQAAQTNVRVYLGGVERGYYNHNTGEIYLNLNAKNASKQSYMAYTLGHELGHRAKEGSPAKYKAFADFLVKEYGKNGADIDTMIGEQLAAANKFDESLPDDQKLNMTREQAFEEVVCDACQKMLLDTNAGQKLAEFGAQSKQNKSFIEDLKIWIKEFMDKLRAIFKGVDPDSLAAKEFAKFDANVKQILADMYVDMTMDAGEKLSTIKAAKDMGNSFVDEFFETKQLQYNLAAVESHKAKLQKNYSADSTTDLATIMARYDKILSIWKKLGGELNSKFLEDWNSKVGKDRTFTIFKAQAGYKYNVELSSMCKKGVPLFEAIDTIVKQEVMKELGTDILGKAEKEILYDILKQHNFEIPCAICYVEQARQREGVIISAFLEGKVDKNSKGEVTKVKLGWNQVLDSIEKEMKASSGVDYKFAQVSRDIATEKYVPANIDMDIKTQAAFYAALKKIANKEIDRYNKAENKKRKLLNEVTPEAVKECFKGTLPANLKIFKTLFNEPNSRFKIQNDLLYSSIATQNLSMAHNELYSLFNSQGGVSGYKTKQGTTIYWGDILGKNWKPDVLRKEGGVRNQSNSDFQMYTFLDQAQMYLDFTAKGYYLQAYTKVLSELKLFGLSNGKINASLIPKVVVYRNADGGVDVQKTMENAGLDEKGNPIFDDIEGINHNEAFMLIADPEYSKSICGICIGYSDNHIRKLLDDSRVQLIIGFHDKTDDGSKRYKGARYAKNYNGLNEAVKFDAEGKPKTVHIGFNPYVKKAEGRFKFNEETESFEGTTTFNGKSYVANDIPRLAADMYLDMCQKKNYSPAYEDFAGHPNYYKLLADFGLYDSQGNYAPHKKVSFNMPDSVPYLDLNGKKKYMSSSDYIKAELQKELAVRDSISEALADNSSEGIIPQFKYRVQKMKAEQQTQKSYSLPKVETEYAHYDDVAILKEETVDKWLSAYASKGSPNYAQAYIAYMKPNQFLDLTTSISFRHRIEAESKKLNEETFAKATAGQPLFLDINHETGEVTGHEGRHRCVALLGEGIYKMPVLLFDSSNKYSKKEIPSITLKGQDFGSSRSYASVDVENAIPLSYANRDAIIKRFATQSYTQKKYEEHGIAKTLRYSLPKGGYDYSQSFSDQVEAYKKGVIPKGDTLILGGTPEVFQKAGFNALPMSINTSHVDYALYGTKDADHNLGEALLKQLPTRIKEPVALFVSDTQPSTSVVALLNFVVNNNQVVAAVYLDGFGRQNRIRFDSNAITSVFGKQNALSKLLVDAIANEQNGRFSLLYINKKEANSLLQRAKLQLLGGLNYDGFIHSIREANSPVKPKFDNVTETQQFKRWFGDWQKKPSVASKVVNDDGTPMIVYHGSATGNIKIFQTANKNGTGGLFLSTNKSVAQGYAGTNGEVYATYVNIRKPFIVDANNSFYDSIAVPSEMKGSKYVFGNTVDTNAIAAYARASGYDGVIVRNVREVTGFGDDIIAFEPEQIKSTNNIGLFDGSNPNIDYKLPVGEDTSPRALLSNALETAAQNDIEKRRIAEYKGKVDMLNAQEAKLREINEQIKEISFGKGKRDTQKLRELQDEKIKTTNRINTLDKSLLTLEVSKPLQDVLQREKQKAYKRAEQKGKEALAKYREKAAETQREIITRYQESKKKAVEGRKMTEMRHKIKSVVNELNQLLLHGSKDKHIMIGLQKPVAEALDIINMDTVNAEARVAKYNDLIAKATDPDVIKSLTETRDRIQGYGDKFSEKMDKLKAAYANIKNSDDPLIANAYDEVIAMRIESVSAIVGNTSLREMSLEQLGEVYDMYKMILTTVRNSNKAFKAKRNETISTLANRTMEEIHKVGGTKQLALKALQGLKVFSWNNLKPIYALSAIGSDTLTEAFNNVRAGEDTWAVDVNEAKDFFDSISKKYGYKNWDFKKRYSFKSTTGVDFELSLEQILSLYAYSKREQADKHLEKGGFVFDSAIEVTKKSKSGIPLKYTVNTSTAHNLSKEGLAKIIGTLSEDQMKFVDIMQGYLSDVMGAKGNEVSLEMYGVKLFNELHYFPLKSAKQFMFEQNESAGEVRIKNSSFSKETVVNASNPIILSNFMDVWANHVNDMAMYHSFVLPLEDFNRIFNYKTPTSEKMNTESVKMYMQNAYGTQSVQYIKDLITDLNGGVRSDPRESTGKKLISRFKKSAVMASASVVVQQPSAVARALALIDAKYFDFNPKIIQHKKLWNEVKKYAPVAIIKEMGRFDTDMGRSTVDFIKGDSTFMEKVDDVLSKPAAYADELTWCHIWTAVKRETMKTRKDLKFGSEAFLKAAGERFTEVIVKTQVYDSVLARSANMRSKSVFMNMVTSFMAEPTTSINMVTDAIRQSKRGNKAYARKAVGAVYASLVLNAALSSIVYAMRDDDEDETILEKYVGSFTTEVIDSFNPLTYLPFVKDAWSIAQGYDVERSDMSLISDAIGSFQNIVKLVETDTDGMDDEELAAYNEKLRDAILSGVDGVASLLGIPEKNIRRDITAAFNTYKTLTNGLEDNATSMWEEVIESAKNSTPIWGWMKDEAKEDKLYKAIMDGDSAYRKRIESQYEDQDAVDNAIRKALRNNDQRIKQAAEAYYNGNIAEYTRIAKAVIADGFKQDNVVKAIMTEVNLLKPDEESSTSSKVTGLYKTEAFIQAIMSGDQATADIVRRDLIDTMVANGKTESEAEESFASSVRNDCKEQFMEGNLTETEAIDVLTTYCGNDAESAEKKVGEWEFEVDYGFSWSDRGDAYKNGEITASELKTILMDVGGKTAEEADLQVQIYDWQKEVPNCDNITASAIKDYNEYCAPAGISKDIYYDAWSDYNDTPADYDEYGDSIPYSKTKKVMPIINALPISSDQKTALALCWWAEGTVNKYKLW